MPSAECLYNEVMRIWQICWLCWLDDAAQLELRHAARPSGSANHLSTVVVARHGAEQKA